MMESQASQLSKSSHNKMLFQAHHSKAIDQVQSKSIINDSIYMRNNLQNHLSDSCCSNSQFSGFKSKRGANSMMSDEILSLSKQGGGNQVNEDFPQFYKKDLANINKSIKKGDSASAFYRGSVSLNPINQELNKKSCASRISFFGKQEQKLKTNQNIKEGSERNDLARLQKSKFASKDEQKLSQKNLC